MTRDNESPAERYQRYLARKAHRRSAAYDFERSLAFQLDDFQQQALDALESGSNVLVAAPTGAGKTVIADFAVYLAQQKNVKAFYTTPIKALSNQKYHELVKQYGRQSVGLLTGDLSINSEANIVVMTTEVLRNMIYERSVSLDALRYVVLDEMHYLGDRFRGPVWEEVIIHLPKSVKIIGLSATVSNIEDFGAWLESVRGATRLIVSEHRPVPLEQHVILQPNADREPEIYDLFREEPAKSGSSERAQDSQRGTQQNAQQRSARNRVNPTLVKRLNQLEEQAQRRDARKKKESTRKRNSRSRSSAAARYTPSRWAVVDELDYYDLLPGIYFIFSRVGCEKAVDQCMRAGLCLTTEREARQIREIADSMVAGVLTRDDLKAVRYLSFRSALENGFAAHHAGMVAVLREIVERVFELGLVKVVFATETLALGLNMPARSVIIEKLTKFNGVGHVPLTAGQYTQLTGRAGRRGIDTVGHAVVVDSPTFDPAALAALSSRRVYPLHSQFTPTFNMAVSLLHLHSYDEARHDLSLSFAQWEANETSSELEERIAKLKTALAGYEKNLDCRFGDITEFIELRGRLTNLERGERRKLKHTRFKSEEVRAKAFEQLDRRIAKTRKREREHPCRQCPDLQKHLKWGQRWLLTRKELQRLEDRYQARTESVARQFDLICSVLSELGYLQGRKTTYSLTEKGDLLRCLFTEKDLLLAQCMIERVFDDLTPVQLAAALSGIIYEPRRSDEQESQIPHVHDGRFAHAAQRMIGIWEDLDYTVQQAELDGLEGVNFTIARAIADWAEGESLTSILRATDLTAGDFVRACKRLCDVLGQVAQAAEHLPDGENLTDAATRAIGLINRDVVAYAGITSEDVEGEGGERGKDWPLEN